MSIVLAMRTPGSCGPCVVSSIAGDSDTGPVFAVHDFSGGSVLLGTVKGLFLAHVVNGAVAIDPAGDAETGLVFDMHEFPGGGMLIRAAKGLFLAHAVNGAVIVDPSGNADTGCMLTMH